MITQSNNNNNNFLLIFLISATLTACSPDEGKVAYEFKATSYAEMVIHEIPLKYLDCYALEPELKE